MLTKSIVKKVSSFRSIGKWVFWNPCFTTDCREVYIYITNNNLKKSVCVCVCVCVFVCVYAGNFRALILREL